MNELGPEAAAAEAIDLGRRDADLRAEVEQTATALAEDFAVGRNGPAWYANFLAANDDRDRSQLEREATYERLKTPSEGVTGRSKAAEAGQPKLAKVLVEGLPPLLTSRNAFGNIAKIPLFQGGGTGSNPVGGASKVAGQSVFL
ncbi:MAG TPA: hypothetical protein VM142_11410 [Acidimicrobiales bacterium]|nr:hypothetical protein [Acidimicrobiales bacterium]